jgi:hypothetical protein
VALGGIAHMVEYPLTGAEAKAHSVAGSVGAAIAAGASIRRARETGSDPFVALAHALRESGLYLHCRELFDGKITDLERETRGGFAIGKVIVSAFRGGDQMEIVFQNENLVARHNGEIRATVPDLITIMDRETADTITTERLKYGQRVKVIAASAPPILREKAALAVVGPASFGIGSEFTPLEQLCELDPM